MGEAGGNSTGGEGCVPWMFRLRRSLAAGAVVTGLAVGLGVQPAHAATARRALPDTLLTDPGIGVMVTPSASLIRLHMTETTVRTPQRFTMLLHLYRWPVVGRNPREYRRCGEDFNAVCVWVKTKDSLAKPGKSVIWNFEDILCGLGQWFFRATIGGVTHAGFRDHLILYFPAGDKGTDSQERPTRGESHRISSCHPR